MFNVKCLSLQVVGLRQRKDAKMLQRYNTVWKCIAISQRGIMGVYIVKIYEVTLVETDMH